MESSGFCNNLLPGIINTSDGRGSGDELLTNLLLLGRLILIVVHSWTLYCPNIGDAKAPVLQGDVFHHNTRTSNGVVTWAPSRSSLRFH
ncbi:hypothetical protein CEXT_553011 [Caerostris extrusa]|uniref:Uncharacterized protein n=1 Tax=Caerostris extrusa TaxID=172846 RepID=A0AAV4VFM6_CAEEX|nr:hypothetical protein CEXT_553011 [Caerostris extrusa]